MFFWIFVVVVKNTLSSSRYATGQTGIWDTIKYLLENHLFDISSVILSEGIPVSEFGENEKPLFQVVASTKNISNVPDSISINVGQSIKHSSNDQRPKRRDNYRHLTTGFRTNNNLEENKEKTVELNGEQNLPSFRRKPAEEYFRAGQSDSDLISLGEIKPQPPLDQVVPDPILGVLKENQVLESGKKSIFEELKNLDTGSFEKQDSLFVELLAATAKNLPKDQNKESQFAAGNGESESESDGDDGDESNDGGGEDDEEEDEEDEDEQDGLVFVNNGGNFRPEVSSVLYEPPNPSKGFNFNNFKPVKDDDRPGIDFSEENDKLDKNNIKRENQGSNSNNNEEKVSFPSFFNTAVIDEELKAFQDQYDSDKGKNDSPGILNIDPAKKQQDIPTEIPATTFVKHVTPATTFVKHPTPTPTAPTDRKILIGKLHQDKEVLELQQQKRKAVNEEILTVEASQRDQLIIPVQNPYKARQESRHESESNPNSLESQGGGIQSDDLNEDSSEDETEKFQGSAPGTDEADLRAFHEELDRLINGGGNPNGEFKSFFRNPSSITFENVDTDPTPQPQLIQSPAPATVTITPNLNVLPVDVHPRRGDKTSDELKLTRNDNVASLGSEVDAPVLIGRYSLPEARTLPTKQIQDQKLESTLDSFSLYEPRQVKPDSVQIRPHSEPPEQNKQETTEVVYGIDQHGDTQVDVVIVETGLKGKVENVATTEKIFDFLYRNVQQVEPPNDLRLNDPNLHKHQSQISDTQIVEENNLPHPPGQIYYKPIVDTQELSSTTSIPTIPTVSPVYYKPFNAEDAGKVYYKPVTPDPIQNEAETVSVYYKPLETDSSSPTTQNPPNEPPPVHPVFYKPLVEDVENPLFKKTSQPRIKNRDGYIPEQAESVEQRHYKIKPDDFSAEIVDESETPKVKKSASQQDYSEKDSDNSQANNNSQANTAKENIFLDESFNPPSAEYDFKPLLSPPPEFFELRPVTNNLFQKYAKEEQVQTPVVIEASTIPVPTSPETISPAPEYSEEDYNNYTEAPEVTYEAENEPQEEEETDSPGFYQNYPQHLPVDPRNRRKTIKPVNTGIYSAFSKVTNVFDSFFGNGLRTSRFGRGRRFKRQLEIPTGSSEDICPTRKHFIHPVVAFSVKGQWMYIVNLPGNESHQQGIVTEECLTTKCNKICTEDPSKEANCQPRFVQKRLVALHPNGEKLSSELFWFPATCSCKIKQI